MNPFTIHRSFGNRQLYVLKHLVDGWHISEVEIPSVGIDDIMIVDEDKANFLDCNKVVLNSLMKREILTCRQVYTTVQPDSFHYRYDLKKEYKGAIEKIIEQKNPKHFVIPSICIILMLMLCSCSFSYSTYRDCDGKNHKTKNHHPKPEWRLGY